MAYQRDKKSKLYGLVLAGGRSSRMEADKSILNYHGISQVRYCYDLLLKSCEKVFVSNREEQSMLSQHKDLPQIHDAHLNIGPLGGILSAMTTHPKTAWLVLACDLPYVDEHTINVLIQKRDIGHIATAYKSTKEPYLPEPLCAIYEPQAQAQLLKFFKKDIYCPRKILTHSRVCLIEQEHSFALENVNTIQEYKKAVETIKANQ